MEPLVRHVEDPHAVNSLRIGPDADPLEGVMRWDPVHSSWNGAVVAAALVLGALTFSWSALTVFLAATGAVLLLGHSVGFHRRLIHRSFDCPRWLEYVLVWIGTAVGMSGPLWMMRVHDTRDWAQRQPRCHPALAHAAPVWRDWWWCLHCRLVLARPPIFAPGPGVGDDRFYRLLERTWVLQQAPVALALYALGGWSWVVWGVCVRVAVSVNGHWLVGRLAHRQGPQSWLVDGAGVQAHDVPWAAIPTMGEAWHNNHHAFPGSARMGLYPGQFDPGFRFIQLLALLGLAWNIRTPATLPLRGALRPAGPAVRARELEMGPVPASQAHGGDHRREIARLLRVNHAGEVGAIRIYRGQLWLARFRAPDLADFLTETLAHEQEHRSTFARLMKERDVRPCRTLGFWAAGGLALGLFAAALGRDAILVCTEAVERTVHGHLTGQVAWLAGRDEALAAAIAAVDAEEQTHLAFAVSRRSSGGLAWLNALIAGATEVLIWCSTYGAAARTISTMPPHLAKEKGRSLAAPPSIDV
ncbi:hypothetical protein C5708_16680 [Caulobacter sp. CCUG 60055]|uniref:demethoxyubiquinone hydroxylase family protein n=2 Tax=Pseudomonadota TaxID=1224 RepID=UPI001FA8137B|nr:demethoxyubiquinone hydroxylase family protein [Caulobacter sp. CCUG 60055]MCI3181882.1 hypothetical protein [Caulobacter sp. CCUG 60055]